MLGFFLRNFDGLFRERRNDITSNKLATKNERRDNHDSVNIIN